LLENQPHDSICGCSVDAVHEEMRQRYEWVKEIGEEIVRQSLRTLGALGPDEPMGTIAVFNPTPQPATGYVTATIPWSDDRPAVALIAPNGERIEARQVGETARTSSCRREGAPAGFDRARRYRLRRRGRARLRLPHHRPEVADGAQPGAGRRTGRTIETNTSPSKLSAEDGTLTVRQAQRPHVRRSQPVRRWRRQGRRVQLLRAETETVVDRPASPPRIRIETGAGVRSLVIEMTYRLPAGLAADRMSRSAATADERIVTTVTLTDGVPRADVHTVVFNAAEDHRLRAYFPSGLRTGLEGGPALRRRRTADRAAAVGPGDVDGRAHGTYPQKAFVSVDDGVRPDDRQPRAARVRGARWPVRRHVAVTLLRCIGWLSRSDISARAAWPQLRTPGAQLHGRNTLDYSIIPQRAIRAGARPRGAGAAADARLMEPARFTPAARGQLLNVESPAFPVSAIKREDGDGVIVRLYNTPIARPPPPKTSSP
jgi:hypothetical protein